MSGVGKKELPEGWASVPLKDAVQVILGQSPVSSTYNYDKIGLPFFQGKTEFGDMYPVVRKWCDQPKKIAQKEDVLVSVRAPVGPTNLAPYECAIGRGLAALRPLTGSNSRYYLYLIRRYQNELAALGTGTTFEAISGDTLKNFVVPIAPPEQQKRIVAKIEQLFSHIDAGIAALNKTKQLLKQYRQSILKAAVTGELTKQWREENADKLEPASQLLKRILQQRRKKWEAQQLEQLKAKEKTPKDDGWKRRYKEPVQVSTEALPTIPNEWEWATLSQLGELNRGKSKHRPRNDPSLYGGHYPFVQTGDIRAANTWLKEYSQTYSEKGLSQSRLWKKGTMCITIAANIADTAILHFDACFPDSVVGFVPLNESIDVEVIEFFIRTVKSDLEQYAPATAQKNINLAILETVAIPLLPVKEQVELINILKYKMSMADRLDNELGQQRLKAEKNKQSILASAFSGRLE